MDWRAWWKRIWFRKSERPIAFDVSATEATQDFESLPPLALSAEGRQLLVGVVSTRGNVRPSNEDNYYVPGHPGVQESIPESQPAAERAVTVGQIPSDHSTAEDSTAESPAIPKPTAIPGPDGLFIVADGMGGQLAGEKASLLAVELIPRAMTRRLTAADTSNNALVGAIRDSVATANREILAQSHLHYQYANMGTTVALVLFRNGRAYVTGIGDSRVYHLRDNKLRQLTRDHSLAQALGDAGTIPRAEIETHRFKNVLYLYLGSRDVGDGPEEITPVDCRPGDQFLLTTDGLTGVVRDEVIGRILATSSDPQRAAQTLINRALQNGSRDNITCIVIQVA